MTTLEQAGNEIFEMLQKYSFTEAQQIIANVITNQILVCSIDRDNAFYPDDCYKLIGNYFMNISTMLQRKMELAAVESLAGREGEPIQ